MEVQNNARINNRNDQRFNEPLNIDDVFFDSAHNYGPLELNILERVENGLEENLDTDVNDSFNDDNSVDKEKYAGKKEVIFV